MIRLGLRKSEQDRSADAAGARPSPAWLSVLTPPSLLRDREALTVFQGALPEGQSVEFSGPGERPVEQIVDSPFVLSLFVEPVQLDALADRVLDLRRGGRQLMLIVAIRSAQLMSLGHWLNRRIGDKGLSGIRLIVSETLAELVTVLPQRLVPMAEDNVLRMPINPEVERPAYRNFFVFSPEMQALVARIRGCALNGISRIYLLGGPGSGKTSLAYYYHLVRQRGHFVTVNLLAENTGNKESVKSLLCGHVAGAFPGAGARNGAFATAQDGTCFLDEGHGITGPVMEVLMEALDSGQFLPLGSSVKRPVDCAVLFATNRSWAHLQSSVNIDEFTRLGATALQVPELHRREEEIIAVAASTLARLAERCTTWRPPAGLGVEAWQAVRACRWHGNERALVRVMETAFVETASTSGDTLIQRPQIDQAIQMWEPETHHSHALYAGG